MSASAEFAYTSLTEGVPDLTVELFEDSGVMQIRVYSGATRWVDTEYTIASAIAQAILHSGESYNAHVRESQGLRGPESGDEVPGEALHSVPRGSDDATPTGE